MLFSKDWKSVSHMFMIDKLYFENQVLYLGTFYSFGKLLIYLRAALIVVNEFVIFRIAFSANIGEDGAIGLIVNFGAALIICELDDIIMSSGRIQHYRDLFDNYENESAYQDEEPICLKDIRDQY